MKTRTWTDEDLISAVQVSFSLKDVLDKLSLKVCGGNYATVKIHIRRLSIDTSHFVGQGWKKRKEHPSYIVSDLALSRANTIPLSQILVRESTYQCTYNLKHRLWRSNLLRQTCYVCGIGPKWQGNHLSLQLDHIDGDRSNNTIENLRILCPNCHSQTDSFAGKNTRKRRMAK